MSNIEEVVNLKEISERFNNGTETIEDIMNYCRNYEIKFENGSELRVVERRYFDKLVERIKELEEESIEYKISDTNVSSIEKEIKRCEQLIKPEHANWIGISNQLAIAHLIDRIKELEAKLEFKKWGDLDNTQFEEYVSQFVPKQKVKDLKESVILDNTIVGGRRNSKTLEYGIKLGKIKACEELLEDK